VTGGEALDLFRLIDLREPELPGAPLAIETAELRVTIRDAEGRERELEFTIYNDRLAQDRTSPSHFYRCSAYLRQLLLTV
jgi:hypothetical protein